MSQKIPFILVVELKDKNPENVYFCFTERLS